MLVAVGRTRAGGPIGAVNASSSGGQGADAAIRQTSGDVSASGRSYLICGSRSRAGQVHKPKHPVRWVRFYKFLATSLPPGGTVPAIVSTWGDPSERQKRRY